MKKRKSFTLLETLIASFLAFFVLSFVGFIFKETSVAGSMTKKKEKEAFESAFLSFRLNSLIGNLLPVTHKKFVFFAGSDNSFFKSGSQNLIFSFDNGVQLNKTFSNALIGRLFLSPDKKLQLFLWPASTKKPSLLSLHKEILLENVDDLQFSYFVPRATSFTPLKSTVTEKNLKPLLSDVPRNEWVKEWLPKYKQPPSLVKIEITKNNQTITFIIPTLTLLNPIVYGFSL